MFVCEVVEVVNLHLFALVVCCEVEKLSWTVLCISLKYGGEFLGLLQQVGDVSLSAVDDAFQFVFLVECGCEVVVVVDVELVHVSDDITKVCFGGGKLFLCELKFVCFLLEVTSGGWSCCLGVVGGVRSLRIVVVVVEVLKLLLKD